MGRRLIFPRARRLRAALLAIAGALALGAMSARGLLLRRQARLHEYFASASRTAAKKHEGAARDCEAFGGAAMQQVAQDYRAQSHGESVRSEYHAKLGRAYWHAAFRPWVILPPDPPPPEVP